MATKHFYLLGESPSTAREVELPPAVEFEELQNIVASHFAIVKPNGVGFVYDDRRLTAVSEVLDNDEPIAVSINGNSVRDVPGPAGIPYFGNYLEIYPDHLGNHQRLFEKYGPLFVTNSMGNRLYQTNSAELSNIFLAEDHYFTKDIVPGHPLHPIKNQEAGVFLADTDTEQWRLAHKFLPPALGPKAVRHYAPTMQRTVEQSFKVFDELDEKGEAWNVYQYMLKLGSQAVGKLVLGMDFAHFEEVDSPLHEMVLKIAENLELNKRVSSMGAWYAKMPFGDPKKVRDTMARIMEMMTESIARASKGQEDLELQDAALKAENVVDYFLRAKDNKGSKLPPSQFAPTLLVATAAGFTTTSSLLSWLIYSLVKYPGNQDRLLQELIDNDWDDNTQVTAETTSKLSFLDKFIKETQRLHNPSFQPGRTAKVDMILPGGYRLPKGAVVISALHHMHNNKDVWENPGRFDPDRWDTEQVKNRPPGSYIPFATGPRMCVGFNFALQEIKVFLPKLVYRYKFSLAQDGPIEYDPYFQLIRPNNFVNLLPRRQLGIALATLSASLLLVIIDQNGISVTLPTIAKDLNAEATISWAGTSSLIANTCFQMLYGRLSDVFGRKVVFVSAALLLCVADLLCSLSQNAIMFYVFRALAGIGGGGVQNLVNIIISDIVTLEQRGKIQGVVGGTVGLGNVIGPFIAAAIMQKSSWRAFFWLLTPLSFITAALAYFFLPSKPPTIGFWEGISKIDWVGSLVSGAGIVLLLIPISGGWEWKMAKLPMMPIDIYKNSSLAIMLAQNCLLGAVYQSYLYYVPLYLQNPHQYSAIKSAAVYTPLVAAQMIASIASGQYISRRLRYGEVIIFGFAIWTLHTSPAVITVILAIVGTGVGCIFQPTLIALQAHSPKSRRAVIISNRNFYRCIGGACGLAVSAAVLQAQLRATLPTEYKSLASSTYVLPEPMRKVPGVLDAYMSASHSVFILQVPLIGLCLLGTAFIRDRGLDPVKDT
ncbi:cytochrome P450 [Fusarium redolens]|uniref:Cytochrome P450 n=1 Tax=Fusarium redolens TaxID=48865 RepID=A0A9P9K0R5_FUSRE|nr:cytochrome P450 [Fusarium redolens]KAH7239981.1 cytochrome P450 [Fusarium redolens]